MNDFLRRNPIIAGLAGLCVLLAAVVAVELVALGGRPAATPARKVVASEAKLLPSLAAVSPDAAYPEVGARPLWIPTRRPAPAPAATAQQAFTRGQFILQGVTIAGSTRIAMLKEKASGRMHRVELGREVNGLHMAEVEPERVTLTQGGEREVIELRVQRAGAASPGSSPQPPSSPVAATVTPVPSRSGGPFAPPATPTAGGPPLIPPGPMPPSARPPSPQQPPPAANPMAPAVPQAQPPTQPQAAAPMTPEELLARRRARRNQPTE